MRFQTMKSCRIQIVFLILTGLISIPAHAEVIPGRWEKVSALEMTTPISVELKNGDRIIGDFEGLSESEVELTTHAATARIPKVDVQTIKTQPKDGLGDGAAGGGLIGAGVFGVMALISKGKVSTEVDSKTVFLSAVGFGVAIGLAVDAVIKAEAIVVYNAPTTPWDSKRSDSEGRRR